jgi:septum formation protein
MNPSSSRLLLASGSPRRRELLTQIGVEFDVFPADIEESPAPNEEPRAYVMRVATDKAMEAERQAGSERPILAADTEVILDGQVFGKPGDRADFLAMMHKLSGREHQVLSAVVLRWRGRSHGALSESRVRFAAMNEQDIERYWRTGEPVGKAGGYAIQGYGALFIAHLSGSFSGVMGLPLHETAQLLTQAGFPVLRD